jgi:hypothetical protein
MTLVATTSATASPLLIVTIIAGVMAACGFFGWMAWRLCKSVERAERDPRYLRRILFGSALLYALGAVLAVSDVVTGEQPPQYLFALIIPAALIWLFIKAASRVKVPPA